ncbi:MAG: HD-GYP domain-containing protein [Termitinemataceae bacterium]|nr:MAG: HD-GYP domain-containing protein [Termitinemataceae bacterium]
MNAIDVKSLKEGEKYSAPLLLEDGGLFVPENVPLRAKDISFLISLDIATVFCAGSLIVDRGKVPLNVGPAVARVANNAVAQSTFTAYVSPQRAAAIDAATKRNLAQTAGMTDIEMQANAANLDADIMQRMDRSNVETSKKLVLLINQLDTLFKDIKTEKAVNTKRFWQITATLLHIIKSDKRGAVDFILGNAVSDGVEIAKSAVNVAILSALISEDMGFHAHQVPEIAAGALLHDIGMLRMPPSIVNKREALSAEEAKIISSHPVSSFKIAYKEMHLAKSVCLIVLQHHERWDGSGYPQHLAENAIDTGALIISVADAFEAMVNKKAYRNSLTGNQAMKNLVSENAVHFSPAILKTFIKIMGIYPIGSTVELSDGSHAKIINVNNEIPLRPVVQIVVNAKGVSDPNGELIDLLKNKQIYIVKALT